MDRNWTGLIAFTLAVAVGVALAASVIIVALNPDPLEEAFGAVITTLAGAAVGAIATYLGVGRVPPPHGPEPDAEAGHHDDGTEASNGG
jgi:hypothetical protein